MEIIGFIGSGIAAFCILIFLAGLYLGVRVVCSYVWAMIAEWVEQRQRARELEKLLKGGDV